VGSRYLHGISVVNWPLHRIALSTAANAYIRAEVVEYGTLVARGSLAACKEHAELRLEGKEYVVKDGDVINFRFAT